MAKARNFTFLDNPNLSLTDAQKASWPYWWYGYYGSDGCDWRAYATNKGLAGIPDCAEEVKPLTEHQAKQWRLEMV